ncbi:MAG: 23S rRNA (uracil(1939)-C(5))-methyltransferase RlmD [Kiritimatiellae bacterium]|nr:23S rRNA (uracil(1939)-C(5))-methyltransferase RlmD [Kiritimatiellia bacterium]MDW8458941.1 23S rRNA (uracil(1939)-C(5))-methyltransferase RlmD [Verrucomicrobiota bacterium]
MTTTYRKRQRIEVVLSDMGDGDRCFGRLADGMAMFVSGPAAVGDRVAAEVTKIKPNYLEARLVEVLDPSPSRITPPCVHFGVCGGCKWQHVDYAEQLRIKRKFVEDALAHIGGISGHVVLDPLPSPLPYAYRNKIEFSFGNRRFIPPSELGRESSAARHDYALGFHAPGRFDKVIDIGTCLLATPFMNRVLDLTREFGLERNLSAYDTRRHVGFLRNLVIRHAVGTDETMVYLITSEHDPRLMADFDAFLEAKLGGALTTLVNGITTRRNTVARGDRDIVVRGRGVIRERLGNLYFEISPTSFFQTNTVQAERLYGEVLKSAGLTGHEVVFDLYCGTGTIGLWLAPHCRRVLGFEVEAASIRDAEANARLNGIGNAEFLAVDLKDFTAAIRALPDVPFPDVVVVDPPRAGLHPRVVAGLRALKPHRIVYVSCNPATLARDVRELCADGLYRLGSVQPVDLFPQTGHIECVAPLNLAG